MPSKYDGVRTFFEGLAEDRDYHAMRIDDFEQLVAGSLPASARRYSIWWSNDESHSQARLGWLAAGWENIYRDLAGGLVRFRRLRLPDRDSPETVDAADPAPKAPEFLSWRSYWSYSREVREAHRFIWSQEVLDFLDCVRATVPKRAFQIDEGTHFFRARIGLAQEGDVTEDGRPLQPIAYAGKEMKPRPNRASEGRANPAGIPVLYLAFDEQTAIAEVRPWPGATVSIAAFRTRRDLAAVDLTVGHGEVSLPEFDTRQGRLLPMDANTKEKAVWTDIDNAFSRPVNRADDHGEYVPTQILTELFRDAGFDAIVYGSQFADGINLVCFDPDDAFAVQGVPFKVEGIEVRGRQYGNPWHAPREPD